MNRVRKTAFLLALVALTGCGRTYDQVPDPFYGKWSSDKLTTIVAAKISAGEIILVDEDGRAEICSVDYVNVHYPLFGKSKRTTVVCKTGSRSAKEKARRSCATRDYKLYRWTVLLEQEDSEEYGLIDILENTDTNCDDVDYDMPLGMFSRE
jgi:hypothetical protein